MNSSSFQPENLYSDNYYSDFFVRKVGDGIASKIGNARNNREISEIVAEQVLAVVKSQFKTVKEEFESKRKK